MAKKKGTLKTTNAETKTTYCQKCGRRIYAIHGDGLCAYCRKKLQHLEIKESRMDRGIEARKFKQPTATEELAPLSRMLHKLDIVPPGPVRVIQRGSREFRELERMYGGAR